ncbi:hypothetical protein AURDEDRAFT_164193 [Auricularia subglabra TFB-10046 SS5]|nr:hypothetical protein AURDEDRAFT_164193 [Auricularia subglabra TFB-10046 SS5]
MDCYTEHQRKAQKELDRALWNRFPESKAERLLHCVWAIVRATYRRYPATPLGVTRAVGGDHLCVGFSSSGRAAPS